MPRLHPLAQRPEGLMRGSPGARTLEQFVPLWKLSKHYYVSCTAVHLVNRRQLYLKRFWLFPERSIPVMAAEGRPLQWPRSAFGKSPDRNGRAWALPSNLSATASAFPAGPASSLSRNSTSAFTGRRNNKSAEPWSGCASADIMLPMPCAWRSAPMDQSSRAGRFRHRSTPRVAHAASPSSERCEWPASATACALRSGFRSRRTG